MNEEQPTLLPCPFCGEQPQWYPIGIHAYAQVICTDTLGGCGAETNFHASNEKAIAAWNLRAPNREYDRLLEATGVIEQGLLAEITRLREQRTKLITCVQELQIHARISEAHDAADELLAEIEAEPSPPGTAA